MSTGAASSGSGTGAAGSTDDLGASEGGQARSVLVPVGAFVAWTLFVWIGRVRNVSADATLSGMDRWGPLVMSVAFVVGAVVVAALLYRDKAAPGPTSSAALRNAVWVVAGYTTVIWVVRAGDIALGGDHDVAFVVVHVVLATVSIGLGIWAGVTSHQRRAHITSVRA